MRPSPPTGSKSAIDWLVPHQAEHPRVIQATARKLELPGMERVIVTVQDHGNTSSASVPLAFDQGVRDGRIKRGELVLLEAFGGSFTWELCAHPLLGALMGRSRRALRAADQWRTPDSQRHPRPMAPPVLQAEILCIV